MDGHRQRRWLSAILVASAALKLLLLVPAHHTEPVRDAYGYAVTAGELLETGRYDSNKGPLYPATLAASFALARALDDDAFASGRHLDLARFFQVLVSTATAWLVFLFARELFDGRAAVAAAAIFAFYPTLVSYSHLLWSETLLLLPLTACFWLLLRGSRTTSAAACFASGVLLGLAALTRAVALGFVPVVALWLLATPSGGRRRAALLATAFSAGALLTVAPWTIRNATTYGAFVPISPFTGTVLIMGASDDFYGEIERSGAFETPTENRAERDRRLRAHALGLIRSDLAGWGRRTVTVNLPRFFAPGSIAIEYLARPYGYGAVPGWLGRALLATVVLSYLALMVLAVLGATLAPDVRRSALFGLLVASTVAVHMVGGGFHRHRLILVVFAIAYAGYAASRSAPDWRALPARRRWLAGGALGGLALLIGAAPWQGLAAFWRGFPT